MVFSAIHSLNFCAVDNATGQVSMCPSLFKRWTALSKTHCVIHWIETCPVDSVIHFWTTGPWCIALSSSVTTGTWYWNCTTEPCHCGNVLRLLKYLHTIQRLMKKAMPWILKPPMTQKRSWCGLNPCSQSTGSYSAVARSYWSVCRTRCQFIRLDTWRYSCLYSFVIR